MPAILRREREFTETYYRYVDMVYRVCYSFMKNPADTEDMVQETFLRLMSSKKAFHNESHQKAWLIVTASNLCKDALKARWRTEENIEDYNSYAAPEKRTDSVLEAILALSPDYKTVVYMFYYEGYSTAEIARFLRCPEATVRSRLHRARKQLHSLLGGDQDDEA